MDVSITARARSGGEPVESSQSQPGYFADRSPPWTYVFDDELELAVNLAMATGRPLLIRGPSGVGKSAMARAVAWWLGCSYLSLTVTSRTLARDLVYTVDELARLRDAQANRPIDDFRCYVTPGPLFWAFDPQAARALLEAANRGHLAPNELQPGTARAVVLIDEIDKADPDVPNNLLEPLGSLSFVVPEVNGLVVRASPERRPFLVITTNEERDLADALNKPLRSSVTSDA
jgi:MoxR-like ATPase